MRSLLLVVILAGTARADDIAERVKRVQRDAVIVDTHLDAPDQLASKWADIANKGATDHFDLPRAKEGGLTAPFFSIYVSQVYADNGAAKRALELIDITRRVIAGHNDTVFAGSVEDIRAAKKAGKLAILMGIEGGHAIEDSLGVLREMYRAGVRYMTLTHVNTNHWADSSGPFYLPDFDPKQSVVHKGLNDFGREVVKEMNRIGMIVDVSHVSDATIDDVLEVSRAPVMASHSSCRALSNMPRNLTDDQIKRIVAKGGVVNINFGSVFLSQAAFDAFEGLRKQLAPQAAALKKKHAKNMPLYYKEMFALFEKERAKLKRAALADVVAHIEHVIDVAGIDAVGLGTDFDGIDDPPTGVEDYAMLPALTAKLLEKHTDAEVKKILGENFLAFFARVEAVRNSLVNEPVNTAVLKK